MALVDEWMIRTAQNRLTGPLTREQVCRMITERQLLAQDEVCHANDYWFALHETEEVRKFLGISLPPGPPNRSEDPTLSNGGHGPGDDPERTDPDMLLTPHSSLPTATQGGPVASPERVPSESLALAIASGTAQGSRMVPSTALAPANPSQPSPRMNPALTVTPHPAVVPPGKSEVPGLSPMPGPRSELVSPAAPVSLPPEGIDLPPAPNSIRGNSAPPVFEPIESSGFSRPVIWLIVFAVIALAAFGVLRWMQAQG